MVKLRDNEDEWKDPRGRKKTKKASISGTNTDDRELKGVPPRDFWQFSVTRLDEKTTDDAVRRFLHKAGVEVKEVWMLPSKFKGTKTAKIRVAREHREKAKAKSIWPLHCLIRDWDFSRRKANSDQQQAK